MERFLAKTTTRQGRWTEVRRLIWKALLLLPGISSDSLRPVVSPAWISARSTASVIVCGDAATVEVFVRNYAGLQFANVVTTHAVDL